MREQREQVREVPAGQAAPPDPVASRPDRGRLRLAALAVVLLSTLALVPAVVPWTIAEGGEGAQTWRLQLAPGIPGVLDASVRLESPAGTRPGTRIGSGDGLGAGEVFFAPDGGEGVTVVVGPAPREISSVRVTSAEHGVGESSLGRVLWRRIHVEILPGDVEVNELVGIAPDGQVVEVVGDLPRPSALPTAGS